MAHMWTKCICSMRDCIIRDFGLSNSWKYKAMEKLVQWNGLEMWYFDAQFPW